MAETHLAGDDRARRRTERMKGKAAGEYRQEAARLRERADFLDVYDYFLRLAEEPFSAAALSQRVGAPLAGLFCLQTPLEIFLALGLHPVRLCAGSQIAQQAAASSLPVLMCPMLKSFVGHTLLYENDFRAFQTVVLPTTCDWVVKIPEIMGEDLSALHYMELPHYRDTEKARIAWREEVAALVRTLEEKTGRKLTASNLRAAVGTLTEVWALWGALLDLRRKGVLPGIWILLLANTFMLDRLDVWTEHLRRVLRAVEERGASPVSAGIFVAGSPSVFPNFKMLEIIEQAGMAAIADDLCTSERIFPGGVAFGEPSRDGLLRALSERYHTACLCPTFIDNDRRVNNIFLAAETAPIRGVVYHLLKGCHPYDMEAITVERRLRESGLKFIKIETDYGREDSQNIATRLEAFRQTLD